MPKRYALGVDYTPQMVTACLLSIDELGIIEVLHTGTHPARACLPERPR